MLSSPQIITDISEYMQRHGGAGKDWYIGISANPNETLFNGHGVDREKDSWTYRRASSPGEAKDIKQAYLGTGCEVGPDGWDDDAVFVYAYRKSSKTTP